MTRDPSYGGSTMRDDDSRVFTITDRRPKQCDAVSLSAASQYGSQVGSEKKANIWEAHNSPKSKLMEYGMQVAIVTVPLIIIIWLSLLALIQAWDSTVESDAQIEVLDDAVRVTGILKDLMEEQETVCDYLIAIKKNEGVLAITEHTRQVNQRTDETLNRLRATWDKETFGSIENIEAKLLIVREEAKKVPSCTFAVKLYEKIVHPLSMAWVHHLTTLRRGKTCQLFTSFQTMTFAHIFMGHTTEVGLAFFSSGLKMTKEEMAAFHVRKGITNGLIDTSLDVILGAIPPADHKDSDGSHFHWLIQLQRLIPNVANQWRKLKAAVMQQDLEMTKKLDPENVDVYDVENWVVVNEAMRNLNKQISTKGRMMLAEILRLQREKDTQIMALLISITYAVFLRRQRLVIFRAAEIAKRQSKLILIEQEKASLLLNHMLPKAVAEALRKGETVVPESYQSVSIIFADVVGFSALVHSCTPQTTVQILNNLYSGIDDILEMHSCYKVEIVNDCIVISSGVPYRCGNRHSDELATTALDVLMKISNQELPHLPGEHLLMRIGMHTGPCTTGVIGVNKPKFCLFGDAVNTSSRMMSSSEAMCIHITQDTHAHLEQTHPGVYDFEERGKRFIKGKGEMMTYWLKGKEEHPYTIDIKNARMVASNTTYYKMLKKSGDYLDRSSISDLDQRKL